MKLYNTLSRKIEEFTPLNPPSVTLYTCGPTVYDYTHIGHLRKYINDDILKRTLTFFGYKVRHVQNITDVGHLSQDTDEGEDKLEKGAKKYQKTVWEVAAMYTDYFNYSMQKVGVLAPDIVCPATQHIPEMIALITRLEQKGFVYETEEAVYFETAKFASYGKLSGQSLNEKQTGVRSEVMVDPKKRKPADFALWFKRVGRFANHTMHWDSPWGTGFPGWHIECSAMSMKYLGQTIDIHTGGVDHIPVHHENEIAQSEAATAKQFVRFWVHHEFLLVEGQKMSKSLGNFYTVDDVIKKGIDPLSLRLLFLQSHYHQQTNFTWESAQSANEAYRKLKDTVRALQSQSDRTQLSPEKLSQTDEYKTRFQDALSSDLQTPQAVAVMWEALKSNIPSADKLDLIFMFDEVLGLNLRHIEEQEIPEEVAQLAQKRQAFKEQANFKEADDIRKAIRDKGYNIEDLHGGYTIKKI